MKKIYSLFLSLLTFFTLTAQNEFVANNNAQVTLQSGAYLYVGGTITSNNSQFTNDGEIELTGDWIVNGVGAVHNWVTSDGERTVIFRSPINETQTIRGTSPDIAFYNVIIDNNRVAEFFAGVPFGWDGGVELDANITIVNKLNFENTNSKVYAGSRSITIDNDEVNAILNYDIDRYIQFNGDNPGTLTRKIVVGQVYQFPIGTEWSTDQEGTDYLINNYAPFEINLSGITDLETTEYLSATFRHEPTPGFVSGSNPNFAPAWGASFNCEHFGLPSNQHIVLNQMVKNYGAWEISPLKADFSTAEWNETSVYDITFYPNWEKVHDSINPLKNNFAMYKVLKAPEGHPYSDDWGPFIYPESGDPCSGINSEDFYDYNAAPNQFYTTNINDWHYNSGVTAHELNSFSKFGLAGADNGDIGVPLPVELLYLKADPVNNEFIKVSWSTAVEIDNAGFYLERSLNGIDFEEISWIPGNGNTTNQMFYAYNDLDVIHNQVYYYRLRQIDYDGAYEYSYIVNASLISGNVFDISEFIPNPSADQTRIIVSTSTDREITVRIFNTLGQIVKDDFHHIAPGQHTIDFNLQNLADGTYHAIFMTNNEVYNRKLVITK